MARPVKQIVDYFPHDSNASSGKTLYVLESKFGNDGYAFWFKLLELLASTPGHYYDCRNPIAWEFLQAKTRLNGNNTQAILDLLVELEAIDKDLWDKKVIWIQNLVNNISDVYKNRRAPIPEKPSLVAGIVENLGKTLHNVENAKTVSTDNNPVSTDNNPVSVCRNASVAIVSTGKSTQTKLKETKPISTSRNRESAVVSTDNNPPPFILLKVETKTKQKKESKLIFAFWNAQPGLIHHEKLKDDCQWAIVAALRDHRAENIKVAIKNYCHIVTGQHYYFKYKWTLKDFLKRGLDKFLDLEIAKNNYRKGQNGRTPTNKGIPGNRPAGAFADLE